VARGKSNWPGAAPGKGPGVGKGGIRKGVNTLAETPIDRRAAAVAFFSAAASSVEKESQTEVPQALRVRSDRLPLGNSVRLQRLSKRPVLAQLAFLQALPLRVVARIHYRRKLSQTFCPLKSTCTPTNTFLSVQSS
jgi:hypothetical protein